jgi:hypothetical protein
MVVAALVQTEPLITVTVPTVTRLDTPTSMGIQ